MCLKTKPVFPVIIYIILLLFTANRNFGQIVETVEVNGRIFSNESNSKNIVIISQEDLDELKIKDFADVFSFFTAVNVAKRGGGDSSYDIIMRGSNFEQVMVLVDGIPFNNPQTGHFNSDFPFSIRDVERIEIIRGGSSTAYGPGAFAGVLNIILKENRGIHFSATTGEKKYFASTLSAGKKSGNLSFFGTVDRSRSDGYYEGREFDHWKFTAGTSYKKTNTQLDFNAGYLKKNFGAAGFYAPYPSLEKNKAFYYRFQFRKTSKQFTYSLNYNYNTHDDWFVLDRNRPAFFKNESDTSLKYLSLSLSYKDKAGKLDVSAGGELKNETMDSSAMGKHKRNGGGAFLNFEYKITTTGGIDIGIRRNFVPGRNSNFTYYAGIFKHFHHNAFTWRAGYGKSFRLPSFTELYYNSPGNIGDKNLKPEISRNIETSLTFLKGRYQADLSFFYRDQDNVIDWIKVPSGKSYNWVAMNIPRNDIIGVEFTQQVLVNLTRLSFGIERLTSVNEHECITSKYGLRFPDFSIKANLMQPIKKIMNISMNYCYKRIYKTTEKGHFMNVVLSVPVGKFEISLRADNLFNTRTEEIPGIKTPGRWMYVSIQY